MRLGGCCWCRKDLESLNTSLNTCLLLTWIVEQCIPFLGHAQSEKLTGHQIQFPPPTYIHSLHPRIFFLLASRTARPIHPSSRFTRATSVVPLPVEVHCTLTLERLLYHTWRLAPTSRCSLSPLVVRFGNPKSPLSPMALDL